MPLVTLQWWYCPLFHINLVPRSATQLPLTSATLNSNEAANGRQPHTAVTARTTKHKAGHTAAAAALSAAPVNNATQIHIPSDIVQQLTIDNADSGTTASTDSLSPAAAAPSLTLTALASARQLFPDVTGMSPVLSSSAATHDALMSLLASVDHPEYSVLARFHYCYSR